MGTMCKTLHINEVIKFYELKPGVAYQKGDYRKDGRRDFIRRLVAIPPEDSHGLQNSPGGSDQYIRMSEKASSMVEVVDDAELLTLEEEFVNCAFVDADEIISVGADGEVTNWGRTRIIVAIEWSDETDAYEALTHLANEDGTRKGEGQHLVPAHYIIGEGLRQMIGWHNADMDVDL
jgi:hypothetical protein|tara:strand:+ start:142 stop:672 length:531 start_codon:yes stop_codon:yes gene_type:complete